MEIQNNVYLPLPHVYEREGRQERAWDIYSRLLRDRIIFIGTQIDSYVANSIIAQLLFFRKLKHIIKLQKKELESSFKLFI